MDNENIRAILKPTGYKTHRTLGLKEKLFEYEFSPMVAYGTDKGSHIEYREATDEDELAGKIAEIKKVALDNISKIQVNHSVQEIEGNKLFLVDPHEYASEKILDKEFLSIVARELGTESFLVGIPHQGVFAAMSSMSNFSGKFMGFIKQKFENPEANPITPHVFEILKGEIIAVAGEDTGGNKNVIAQKGNGDLIVEIESTNFEEFKTQVSNGYSQAMLLAMKNKDFSGNIIFNENNKDFTFDSQVMEKCKSFTDQILENEMAQTLIKAMSGNGIVPSFTQNGQRVIFDKTSKPPSTEKTQESTEKSEEPPKKKKKWWQFGK